MHEKVILPFVKATIDCFATMVNVTPVKKEVTMQRPPIAQADVCSLIGLSGDAQGLVAITFSNETAIKIASQFLGENLKTLNEDTLDAVGELINIIAGNAKANLEGLKLSISLPSVMLGENFSLSMPRNVPVVTVSFAIPEMGDLILTVSLKKNG